MLPENFFDEQEYITNVTAIVGENGAGKTTILDIISDAFGSSISSKLKKIHCMRLENIKFN